MFNKKTNLKFLSELKETEFRELILMPLLEAQGYKDIRHTHGKLEKGKDIVFKQIDPLSGEIYNAAVVKSKKITGSVSSSLGIREIVYQTQQVFTEPYIHPYKANKIMIDKCFIFSSMPISNEAMESIKEELFNLKSHIIFIDSPKLLDLINEYLPDLLVNLHDPNFRYLDILIKKLTDNNFLNLSQKVSDINCYIPSKISITNELDAQLISFATPSLSDKTFDGLELINNLDSNKATIILADVGSGKTTLMQKLAISIANKTTTQIKDSKIPIFISLHILSQKSFDSLKAFDTHIIEYIKNKYSHIDYNENTFDKIVLFLDGYDEISSKYFTNIDNIMKKLIFRFGGRLFISSRPSRIPSGLNAYYYKLEPFRNEDIIKYLDAWFSDKEDIKNKLWTNIKNNNTLLTFLRTPLILTLYSLLAYKLPIEKIDTLPIRRTDIYAEICEQLLGDWDQSRNIKNNYIKSEKEYILEQIAHRCHTRISRTFDNKELLKLHSNINVINRNTQSSESIVNELLYRSSLIKFTEDENLEFIHLSFQEYFTAKALSRNGNTKFLKENIFNNWYRGVWLFYFGIKRNLNEISSFKASIYRGNGLRLLEYLTEADYTHKELKDKIFHFISNELLEKINLSNKELNICKQIGEELLYDLHDVVLTSKIDKTSRNIFKIAVFMNSQKSRIFLINAELILYDLSLDELLNHAEEIPNWGNLQNLEIYFVKVLNRILDHEKWREANYQKSDKNKNSLILYKYLDKLNNLKKIISTHSLLKKKYHKIDYLTKKIKNNLES